jgi:glycosyltransferase involved in cell wall biosynthesis
MTPTERPLAFNLIIPCYNNKEGLIRSLESIAYPTDQFAVLVIDDGSGEPVSSAWFKDKIDPSTAIEILRLPRNLGITAALNAGLARLRAMRPARYVARLDCGDVCALRRFYEQVDFLDEHGDIDLVGSWCTYEDELKGTKYEYRTPVEHEAIRKGMYFRNIFVHPSTMWRMSALENVPRYPDNFPHAEDYGFFYSMIQRGRCAVLPKSLLVKEITPSSVSVVFRRAQLKSRMKVVRKFGENRWLTTLGVLKLWLLLATPSSWLLHAKKMLYTPR